MRNAAIASGKTVTEADFGWMLGQLTGTGGNRGNRAAVVSLVEDRLTTVTLSLKQQAALRGATLPLLTQEDPTGNIGLIQERACEILQKYPDARAIPRLRLMTASPHPWVRNHAALALNAAGYEVPVPPRPTSW